MCVKINRVARRFRTGQYVTTPSGRLGYIHAPIRGRPNGGPGPWYGVRMEHCHTPIPYSEHELRGAE